MARDSSFDGPTVDMQEVDNAYQQATREIAQRHDLKGTKQPFLPRQRRRCVHGGGLGQSSSRVRCVTSSDPSSLSAALTSLFQATRCRLPGHERASAGAPLSRASTPSWAKRILAISGDSKLKAKATIEGDKLRVSFSKDALQQVYRPASRQRLRPAPPVR